MRLMLKTCIFLVILILTAYSSIAQNADPLRQNQCRQQVMDFPAVRGLKLGMSSANLLEIYPKVYVRYKYGKDQSIAIDSKYIKDEELKRNLYGIETLFINDNLIQFVIWYEHSKEWESITSFTESHAESLNIPIKFWKINSVIGRVSCDGFSVLVSLSDKPDQKLIVTSKGRYNYR